MYWLDTPRRYGLVSRLLHWTVGLLIVWQMTGMVVKLALGKHPVSAFFVSSHANLGTLLFALIVLRAGWALSNRRHRPPHDPGFIGIMARAGHVALHALMLIVPLLALLRAFGSGKGFSPFGLPLVAPTGVRIDWMVAPANLLHGVLAWILLVLIAGHIAMVIAHRFFWRDDVTSRMI